MTFDVDSAEVHSGIDEVEMDGVGKAPWVISFDFVSFNDFDIHVYSFVFGGLFGLGARIYCWVVWIHFG